MYNSSERSSVFNLFFYFSPCLTNIMYLLKKSISIGFIVSEFVSYAQIQSTMFLLTNDRDSHIYA